MRAEHSATQNDDVNRGAPNAIDLDFDTSSYTKQKDGEYPGNDYKQSMRFIFSQRINSAGKRDHL